MITYYKTIEITDTGMVFASVFCSDGRRIGLEKFASPFDSVKKRCIKAHRWANERLELAGRMEIPKSKFK